MSKYGGPLKFVVPICKDCERKDKFITELKAEIDRLKIIEKGSVDEIEYADKYITELKSRLSRMQQWSDYYDALLKSKIDGAK